MLQRVNGIYRRRARRLAERIGGVNWGLPPSRRAVAITFDDGPDPEFTPAVLDVLARHGVVATFFLVGSASLQYPELVRQTVSEGHAIGSHSFTHPEISDISVSEVYREYRRGRDAVSSVVGRPVRLFRPPKGWFDVPRSAVTNRLGMQTWLWTSSGDDWVPGTTKDRILHILGAPSAGDVVLFHDAIRQPFAPSALDRSATVAAIDEFIPMVRRIDLELVALP